MRRIIATILSLCILMMACSAAAEYDEPLTFSPEHPSGIKTWQIETTEMPLMEQEAPFEVRSLYDECSADLDNALAVYQDKRFEVTGIAVRIGPDIHNKPSIELSDRMDGQCLALVIFPNDDFYDEVSVGDRVTIRGNYLVMSNWFGVCMKNSELIEVQKEAEPMNDKITLNYPVFDGMQVWENASVVIENGVISNETVLGTGDVDSRYFLMPGLIDCHTHMGTQEQVETMLRHGITATCDVSASQDLIAASDELTIHSSAGMAMGVVLSGKNYVEKAAANGAKYMKVLLFSTHSIGKTALRSIVNTAHEKGLKVAVHATEVATMQQAVDAGADILLHVPLKEAFPKELARVIASKGIAVAPTLVMMETFSSSGRNGYKPADYANAEAAVRLLHDCGVNILAATDANPGSFAPGVVYGSSLHREMELLLQAGLTTLEVLQSATSKNARAFDLTNMGTIAPGQKANLILVEGRPDRNITDSMKIVQIWIDGKPMMK